MDILSILEMVFSAKFMNYRIKNYIFGSKTFLVHWKKYVLWENKIGNHIERSKFKFFKAKSFSGTLISDIKETTKIYLLDNEISIREDYLEMAKLCLVYIGGELPKKYSKLKLRAPSAYHHARWMSKVLYVLKIAMLKPTFVENIEEIRSLALFYFVYNTRAWLTSMFDDDAPLQDLTLLKI